MSEPVIELNGVSRWFGHGHNRVDALCDLSLQLPAGSQTVVIGPSGSGKTTLLNLLGALDFASSGTVRVAGRPLSSLSEKQAAQFRRRQVGFVFQDNALLPELTVLENVELPLVLQGVPTRERRQRCHELLERLRLQHRSQAFIPVLSGGEKQRVAVARAVIHQPQIVLADEPTANLDSHAATAVLETLRDLGRSRQLTVVVATHDARVYQQFEQQIALDDGRLVRC